MKLIIETPTWEVNKSDLSEIVNKMQAIELNITKIFEELKKPLDILQKELNIEVDISEQYDEFYIIDVDKKSNFCLHLEVVTRDVAISNDKEYLSYLSRINGGDMSEYEVGGSLSDYKKLGNSIFYYKEM